MKYKIPQDKLDKIVFKYLDIKLPNLKPYKPQNYTKGIVYKQNLESLALFLYQKKSLISKSGILYISDKLIDEISSMFSLDDQNAKETIGRWASDRLQIKTKEFLTLFAIYR